MKDEKINFLKKVADVSDEVLIKKFTSADKKGVEKNSITVADKSLTYMIYSSQDKVFDDTFGMKNVKDFLRNFRSFDGFKEEKNNIIFKDKGKKVTFRKLDSRVVDDIPIPKINIEGYTYLVLTNGNIKKIIDGFKDYKDLSDYASFSVDKDDTLTMKIGEEDYENIFELEIANIKRKTHEEVKFITNLDNLYKLFKSLDIHRDGNKVTMYIKPDNPMVIIENNDLTLTKYYVAPITPDEEFEDMG